MNANIESQLRKFIAANLLFADEAGLPSDDESLLSAGVIDSTGIMELVEFVSSEFGLEVPMKDINQTNFDSIQRLADYVRRQAPPLPAPCLPGSAVPLSLPPL